MDYIPAAEVQIIVPAAEVRVVDGDTIRLGVERIRLIDIDAPEMASGACCDAERNLAELAKEKLTEIIGDQRLEIERQGKDRYGPPRSPTFASAAPTSARC